MTYSQIKALDGKSVLAKPEASTAPNSVGMRGSLRIIESRASPGQAEVELVLDYPDMFNEPAHETVIALSAADLERLLKSEHDGVYELTLTESLLPSARPGLVVPAPGSPDRELEPK